MASLSEGGVKPPRIPVIELESLDRVLSDFDIFLGFPEGTMRSLIDGLGRMDNWSGFNFRKSDYYIKAEFYRWDNELKVEVGGPHGSRVFRLKPKWTVGEEA